MVKIRLTRTGRKNHATYRVVVLDSHNKRDTKAIEIIGYHLPHEKKTEFVAERVNYWLSVGAQPSDTVRNLLVKAGILKKTEKTTKKHQSKPGKKATERVATKESKAAEKASAAAAAKAEAEKPAEEPATEVAEEPSAEAVTETAPEAEADSATA